MTAKRRQTKSGRSRKAKKRARPAVQAPLLEQINLHAAGIDIGADELWVAVPEESDPEPVQMFGTLTCDLEKLADWLLNCGVKTVAMESTGVYWVPLYDLLEQRGLEAVLVDPRQVKNVPGRKSDVLDCQWIQRLHTFGLLRASFRPSQEISVLRSYARQREMLICSAGQCVQHMQKALTQMNVQIHRVISDVTGVTGMRMVRAILAGERDPHTLASKKHRNCRKSTDVLAEALKGTYRPEHLFSLRQAVELYDTYQAKIKECDVEIERYLGQITSGSRPQPKRKPRGNAPAFDVSGYLLELTGGVDLTEIDGFDELNSLKLISEIGTDTSRWPSPKDFCSWLALCPGAKISGGKVLSARTRSSANRAAAILRVAAWSLSNSKSALGAFLRRKRAFLGHASAVTATAHKLARIIYAMLRDGTSYSDPGADYFERAHRDRTIRQLRRKASRLGFTLTAIDDELPAPCAT